MLSSAEVLELYLNYRWLLLIGLFSLLCLRILYSKRFRREEISSDDSFDRLSAEALSTENQNKRRNKVLELERQRVDREYKPGWLYYRCRELGYLAELDALRKDGLVATVRFDKTTRTFPSGSVSLSVELVPSSCWFSNLRSSLTEDQWKDFKKLTYLRASYRCEICGGKGAQWPVEAHEVWQYDDNTNVQKLISLVALCPQCHQVKHFGFANMQGQGKEALRHLANINRWTEVQASAYVDEQFEIWSARSEKHWTTDLSALETYGLSKDAISELEACARQERISHFESIRIG